MHRSKYARTRCAFGAFLVLPLAHHVQAQSGGAPADPWFATEVKRDIPEKQSDDSEDTVVINAKNPKALFRQLKANYDKQAEGNLARRISLLEEMIAIAPGESAAAQKQLTELKKIQTSAIEAIATASAPGRPLRESLADLSPYGAYFAFDPGLLLKLLDSPFANRLDASIRALAREDNATELAAIDQALSAPAISRVFGQRYRESIDRALGSIVQRRWALALDANAPLPGEGLLVSQLLQLPDAKLRLAIEFEGQPDEALRDSLRRSLQRRLGNSFEIAEPLALDAAPELGLRIDATPVQQERIAAETSKNSTIFGSVTEQPNPEFVALVEKYQKAAQGYKDAVENYEIDYQIWLDSIDTTEYDRAQDDFQSARQQVSATSPTLGNGESNPEYASAVQDLEIAQSVANSVEPITTLEPFKPYPHHLRLVEDLFLIPSTIVTTTESTPYVYTERNLTYRFANQAKIALVCAARRELAAAPEISLSRERNWTEVIGASPSDPAVKPGTFSEAELSSTIDLFNAEFAALCAKEFERLASQSAAAAIQRGIAQRQLDQLVLGLALRQTTPGATPLRLDPAALRILAAEPPPSDSQAAAAYRHRCLAAVLSHPSLAQLGIPSDLIPN